MKITPAMATPDGVWRVLLVRQGSEQWYRVVHQQPGDVEQVHDRLTIAGVERLLDNADVDRASLRLVGDIPNPPRGPG
jgi:hypothetical protein